jgi:Glucodextranase, domain B/FecR protein
MPARALFPLAVVGLVAAVPLGWWLFLGEPSASASLPMAAPTPSPDAGRGAVEIHLGDIAGSVEVRRGLDGGWAEAKPGDVLQPSDGVRTTNGSYAVLVGEETWEVKMEPGTEVGIGELKESISRLMLSSGMAKATVRGEGRHSFEIRASSGDAVAQSDGGVFTIATNGQGTVAVGSESGEVAFAGGGRMVIVRAGQQSIIKPGLGPTAPTTIPSSLLLKVALPARGTVNTPKLLVKGDTEPGAAVEVQGRIIRVDAAGHFEVQVPLIEGRNPLTVRAQGVGGKAATAAGQVELDTTVKAPTIDRNLWK